jgi:hypothetical protein
VTIAGESELIGHDQPVDVAEINDLATSAENFIQEFIKAFAELAEEMPDIVPGWQKGDSAE